MAFAFEFPPIDKPSHIPNEKVKLNICAAGTADDNGEKTGDTKLRWSPAGSHDLHIPKTWIVRWSRSFGCKYREEASTQIKTPFSSHRPS